ncbi:MAG: flagellar hook-length control protein FliK [Planctomycetota bacterium]
MIVHGGTHMRGPGIGSSGAQTEPLDKLGGLAARNQQSATGVRIDNAGSDGFAEVFANMAHATTAFTPAQPPLEIQRSDDTTASLRREETQTPVADEDAARVQAPPEVVHSEEGPATRAPVQDVASDAAVVSGEADAHTESPAVVRSDATQTADNENLGVETAVRIQTEESGSDRRQSTRRDAAGTVPHGTPGDAAEVAPAPTDAVKVAETAKTAREPLAEPLDAPEPGSEMSVDAADSDSQPSDSHRRKNHRQVDRGVHLAEPTARPRDAIAANANALSSEKITGVGAAAPTPETAPPVAGQVAQASPNLAVAATIVAANSSPVATAKAVGATAATAKSNGNPRVANMEMAADNRSAATSTAAGKKADTGKPSSASETLMRVKMIQRVGKAFEQARHQGGIVRMKLAPDHLGSLTVEMTVRARHVDATVIAESEAAGSVLREHIGELRQKLESYGMQVERLEVRTEDGGDDARRFGREGSAQSDTGHADHSQSGNSHSDGSRSNDHRSGDPQRPSTSNVNAARGIRHETAPETATGDAIPPADWHF